MRYNVLEYLEQTALRLPNKYAFCDKTEKISFSELVLRAKAVGTSIIRQTGGAKNRPVMVKTRQTAKDIVLFLGVLYSGNCYVPIDSGMPDERAAQIKEKLQPILVLTDEVSEEIDHEALHAVRERHIDTDPCYIIFTSGSTGMPKGIVIPHRAVVDLAEWLCDTFNFSENDVLANQTPFYFDGSVKDIYITLKSGATTFITPKSLFSFPIKLVEYLNENQITAILWATSAITLVSGSKVFDTLKPTCLKKVFFAGEAIYARHLNYWRAALPNADFINLYGPTEVTVDCTYYKVEREFGEDEQVPIGKPCRNMEVFLLDGEICVRGTGVSFGYYNDPDKTREVFIQNPFQQNYPELIYKTGDMGRLDAEGNIVFLARADGQIKHMGSRIELGEIEVKINSFDEIESGFCFYDREKSKIVLVYAGELDAKEILLRLGKSLPKYMFPNVFMKKDILPLNPNGKIDRKGIQEEYFHENRSAD